MAEWSLPDLDCPINQLNYQFATYPPCYQEAPMQPPPPPGAPQCPPPPPPQAQPCPAQRTNVALHLRHYGNSSVVPKPDNPREIRNRAEKMRRDRLNQSVAELAAMVPPVVAARRKIDKTTVLRLTAHYLRAHQYVFGDSIGRSEQEFSAASVLKVLSLFKGFLITVTYRGIIVVVSQNVHQYLGYTELDLLGQNLLNIIHEDDRSILKEQLMTKTQKLGPNGELLIPNEPGARGQVEEALSREKRSFVIRFKKLGQRSEPAQYVTCHIEGSLRKSDRACSSFNQCCQIVRRVRARTENPCSSGNDIVFIGIVRPTTETFSTESALEAYRMEYRTRHSIDGQIIQCEARIALVTGYMTHEVSGVNAMNFMHRDDVRWVIIALREMYEEHKMFGESCYRLMAKNGQFIYMKTRGRLDVDQDSRACTSFVCTNTVVDEKEGRHLIKLMRKKFTVMVNSGAPPPQAIEEEIKDEDNESEAVAVEDPRRLEEVILHLVTNLPSPPPDDPGEDARSATPEKSPSPTYRINIIPPRKEKIIRAIEKIYDVIKIFGKDQNGSTTDEEGVKTESQLQSPPPIFEGKFVASTSQSKIVEMGPHEIFNFGQASNNPVDSSSFLNEPKNNAQERFLNSNVSPDVMYFGNTANEYSNVPSIYDNYVYRNAENSQIDRQDCEPKFDVTSQSQELNFFPAASSAEETTLIQLLPEPSTSYYMSGTKRPSDFEDEEVMYKKKNTEIKQAEPSADVGSPTLESFFDEALFNNQIETAINSLDTLDPSFPDLLTSANVQDILGNIENEQDDVFRDFE